MDGLEKIKLQYSSQECKHDSSVATPTEVSELNFFGTGSSGKLHKIFRIFIDLLN